MAASPDARSMNPERMVWQFADCEFDDLRFQLVVHGQPVELAVYARALARLPLVAHVNLAGGVLANQHRRQARSDAAFRLELRHPLRKISL